MAWSSFSDRIAASDSYAICGVAAYANANWVIGGYISERENIGEKYTRGGCGESDAEHLGKSVNVDFSSFLHSVANIAKTRKIFGRYLYTKYFLTCSYKFADKFDNGEN